MRLTRRKSPEWNRGAYLVEALAHCGECHTPRKSRLRAGQPQKIRGASPAGAPSISAPTRRPVGGWSDDDLASYLSTGHAKGRGTASGPMGEGSTTV